MHWYCLRFRKTSHITDSVTLPRLGSITITPRHITQRGGCITEILAIRTGRRESRDCMHWRSAIAGGIAAGSVVVAAPMQKFAPGTPRNPTFTNSLRRKASKRASPQNWRPDQPHLESPQLPEIVERRYCNTKSSANTAIAIISSTKVKPFDVLA